MHFCHVWIRSLHSTLVKFLAATLESFANTSLKRRLKNNIHAMYPSVDRRVWGCRIQTTERGMRKNSPPQFCNCLRAQTDVRSCIVIWRRRNFIHVFIWSNSTNTFFQRFHISIGVDWYASLQEVCEENPIFVPEHCRRDFTKRRLSFEPIKPYH